MYAGPVHKPVPVIDDQEREELARLRRSEAAEAEFGPIPRVDDGMDTYDPADDELWERRREEEWCAFDDLGGFR